LNIEAGFNGRDNLDKTSSYLNLRGSFSFYQSLGKSLVFAHRTGAATNFGDYDIYFANTLGRSENLRGFWRYRFSGKTSFYQNTELRLALSKRKNFGMLGFFDDGRVWIEEEDSKTFHVGMAADSILYHLMLWDKSILCNIKRNINDLDKNRISFLAAFASLRLTIE
jgi:hemolysin activation/secretion protein